MITRERIKGILKCISYKDVGWIKLALVKMAMVFGSDKIWGIFGTCE